jgi:antirestriction protein ArdC
MNKTYRAQLAQNILNLIRENKAPWQKPWSPGEWQLPFNPTTNKAYRGANIWRLANQGFHDARWCTYRQAQAQGWQVREGAKSTRIEFWQFDIEEERTCEKTGRSEKVKVPLEKPIVHTAYLFNAAQIEGIPDITRQVPEWQTVEAAERILKQSGAAIFHGQRDMAYYNHHTDSIHLPAKDLFACSLDYYEVALHELAHWTGHRSRMDRDLSGGMYSRAYAKEELRAQMASLYLAADLGLSFNPKRHAAYQQCWIKVLARDEKEFLRACEDAQKIADFILDLKLEREKEINQIQGNNIPEAVQKAFQPFQAIFSSEMTFLDVYALSQRRQEQGGVILAQHEHYLLLLSPEKQLFVYPLEKELPDLKLGETLRLKLANSGEYFLSRELDLFIIDARGVLELYLPQNFVCGEYEGKIVDCREGYWHQEIDKETYILHPQVCLDKEMKIGEQVTIRYQDFQGHVIHAREHHQSMDLSLEP